MHKILYLLLIIIIIYKVYYTPFLKEGLVNITYKYCEPKCKINATERTINDLRNNINELETKKNQLVELTTKTYDDPYFKKKVLILYKDNMRFLNDSIDLYNNNYIEFKKQINKLYNIQKKNQELITELNEYNNHQQQTSIEVDKIYQDYEILT
jgi:hypothetical protein